MRPIINLFRDMATHLERLPDDPLAPLKVAECVSASLKILKDSIDTPATLGDHLEDCLLAFSRIARISADFLAAGLDASCDGTRDREFDATREELTRRLTALDERLEQRVEIGRLKESCRQKQAEAERLEIKRRELDDFKRRLDAGEIDRFAEDTERLEQELIPAKERLERLRVCSDQLQEAASELESLTSQAESECAERFASAQRWSGPLSETFVRLWNRIDEDLQNVLESSQSTARNLDIMKAKSEEARGRLRQLGEQSQKMAEECATLAEQIEERLKPLLDCYGSDEHTVAAMRWCEFPSGPPLLQRKVEERLQAVGAAIKALEAEMKKLIETRDKLAQSVMDPTLTAEARFSETSRG